MTASLCQTRSTRAVNLQYANANEAPHLNICLHYLTLLNISSVSAAEHPQESPRILKNPQESPS